MKQKKPNKFVRSTKFIAKALNAIFSVMVAIVKSLTVDLVKNIIFYFKMATSKEELEKIHKKLGVEKNQELIEERLKRVERLTYAIYNDPGYAKRNEGEYDLKHLKKEIDRK